MIGDGGCDARTPMRCGEEAILLPAAAGPAGGNPVRAREDCPACTRAACAAVKKGSAPGAQQATGNSDGLRLQAAKSSASASAGVSVPRTAGAPAEEPSLVSLSGATRLREWEGEDSPPPVQARPDDTAGPAPALDTSPV